MQPPEDYLQIYGIDVLLNVLPSMLTHGRPYPSWTGIADVLELDVQVAALSGETFAVDGCMYSDTVKLLYIRVGHVLWRTTHFGQDFHLVLDDTVLSVQGTLSEAGLYHRVLLHVVVQELPDLGSDSCSAPDLTSSSED
jgi:hypothetical protein